MGYKLLFKTEGKERREGWDNKSYTTKEGAKKAVERAVAKFKGSRYVKDVKHDRFKIVKDKIESNRNNPMRAFGVPSMKDLMRM